MTPGIPLPRGRRFGAFLACALLAANAADARATNPSPPPPLSIRDLTEMADLTGLTLSPDRRSALVRVERPSLDRNSVTLDWFVVSLGGNTPPVRVVSGGAPIWIGAGTIQAEKPQWAPDSRHFFFRALVDGEVQLWSADIDGGSATKLTDGPADILRFRLSEDGKELLYEVDGATRAEIAAAEEAEYRTGIRIDATIDPGQNLYRSSDMNGRLGSERLEGRWFSKTHLLGHRPDRLERLGIGAGGTWERVEGPADASGLDKAAPEGADPEDHGFTKRSEAGEVAFMRGWGRKAELRWSRALGAQPSIACTAPECRRIIAAQWRPVHREIIFTAAAEDTTERLFGWNIDSNRVRPIYASAGKLTDEIGNGCVVGDTAALCIASSGSVPPRLELVPLAGGKSRVAFDPNRELAARISSQARWINWRTSNGRTAWGQLLTPAKRGRAPLVISYYDCRGFLKGGTGDILPFHLFAEAGFAMLCMQQMPEEHAEDAAAVNVAAYEAGLAAIKGAVGKLDSEGVVDARRIGMAGLSFGSEVAIWTAMNSNLLVALSIASPTLDAATYYYLNAHPDRDFAKMIEMGWGLGDPAKAPEPWNRLSAAMNVGKIAAPLLMQLPEQEFIFNMRLYTELLRSGRAADFYVFPHERHIFQQPAHRAAIYERNLDWFLFWLQDREELEPDKVAQYKIWRSLRQQHCSTIENRQSFCARLQPTAPSP